MRVLLVKMSSMGDLIHTLPAVNDAVCAIDNIRFDWVAEEAFAEIPRWHRAVDRVIPISLRRWRRNLLNAWRQGEISAAVKALKERSYDVIIDAQGLIKSSFVTRLASGLRCGLDWRSAREPLASLAYQKKINVSRTRHATERVRHLFAASLGYSLEGRSFAYGLDGLDLAESDPPYLVFLHATSRRDKLWPTRNWLELSRRAADCGYRIRIPWGSPEEYRRAEAIAAHCPVVTVLPQLRLQEIAKILGGAAGIVGVDTGLAHLGAALGIPAVTLYLTTEPGLVGVRGEHQCCLVQSSARADFAEPSETAGLTKIVCPALDAETVWRELSAQIGTGIHVNCF